ncbi:MAG: hypothetical protein HKN19_01390 [Halioglobus sp.]|nr:hypothetical protein [Halioglobus sp.]
MPITRRELVGLLSSSTFFLTVSPQLAAENHSPPDTPLSFPQGVASGDPQPDAVMLWTRAEPLVEGQVAVQLEVSSDEDFTDIILRSRLATGPDTDYTLRAYIDGLAPDQHYYYRFSGGAGTVSRTGRTRTAPDPATGRTINLSFVSCQSYEQAYFGAWARMIEDDRAKPQDEQIEFVLHLGDFIYERCWNSYVDGSELTRRIDAFPDGVTTAKNRYAVSLADYRHLYKIYLSDPHLQEARARWPFIVTWDDHEYSNDNYQSVSTYDHDFKMDPARKTDANQAWFEFIPAVLDEQPDQPGRNFRRPAGELNNDSAVDSLCIYRRLRWGSYLDILLTDLRSYRSAPCVADDLAQRLDLPLETVRLVAIADAGRAYADGNPPPTLPYGDGTVPNPGLDREPGTLFGEAQLDWFLDTLESSNARWKVWGNPLPIMPLRLDMSDLPFTDYEDSIFNVDGWAGFPYELGRVLDAIANRNVGAVVSLSGDHHMHGAATVKKLQANKSDPVAVDFAVAGISSSPVFGDILAAAQGSHGGFGDLVYKETDDGLLPVWHTSMVDGVFSAFTYAKTGMSTLASWLGPNEANDGLKFVDTTANGYGLASFGETELHVSLVTVEDIRTAPERVAGVKSVTRFRVPHWQAGETATLEGPEFEGQPPFPWATTPV